MSERFIVSEDKSDSSDTEDTPALSGLQHSNVESPNIPMERLHHYDTDGVNLEVGENCKASYKRKMETTKMNNLSLFEEDIRMRPKISAFLKRRKNSKSDPNADTSALYPEGGQKGTFYRVKKRLKARSKMGTIIGVYLPCLQNILGVILFLRLTWIVGSAGIIQALLIVLISCTCTLLTTISMSAIATNGVVPAGGSYYMISRALGPEFGGAVGVLFYLGTTFAASMYIIGAIEILLTYIVPEASLFGEILGNPNVLFNNMRVYGTILLLLLSVLVFIGVRVVNYFALFCLACVLVSMVSIYLGIIVHSFLPVLSVCTIDGVALEGSYLCPHNASSSYHLPLNTSTYCSANDPTLISLFNGTRYLTSSLVSWSTEPVCRVGIPGIGSGVIFRNLLDSYRSAGEGRPGEVAVGTQVPSDIATSFTVLLAIFFPSVTGIMAGSNRSGDLKDPQKSIPLGTISAILTTTCIYVSCVIGFGAAVEGFLLRDKFGDSIGGRLVVAELSWPTAWLILIGAMLSTVGAGLQSLTGAPRLLQAIAKDDLLPFVGFFKSTIGGEPTRALILTAIIAEIGILIASLDYVAPIITLFFLMCYMFVNIACSLQSLLKAPNWRPRFKYYHWTLSTIGAVLCLVLMFISAWYYAIITMILALGIYKYIEFRGAEKEWGDGMRSLSREAARLSLLKLEQGQPHSRNWRPQILVLISPDEDYMPKERNLLAFTSQLKAGKGLIMVSSVILGEYKDHVAEVLASTQTIRRLMSENRIQGFSQVIASREIDEGVSYLLQASGLGGLKHNTILLAWPESWKNKETYKQFINTLRMASVSRIALMVTKGIRQFPDNESKVKGNIDIWWIVHDGGLLMLIPFLLKKNKVWKQCNLRIFTVAQEEDNSIQMKKDLTQFLYQVRISAEVFIIELPDCDISAYTYDRTILMEERQNMLEDLKLTRKERRANVQDVVDSSHRRGATHSPPNRDAVAYRPSWSSVLSTLDPPEALQKPQSVAKTNQRFEVQAADEGNPTSLPISPPVDSEVHVSFHSSDPVAMPEPTPYNLRHMNTSVRLNELIIERSHDAKLVVINLPSPPDSHSDETSYMAFLEVLTEGLDRVLMIRGGGREVVSIF
ncbi:Solute carrier family 12 member 6-like [Oopsacas minuta]|uniref:Solute carrier family 12 member 6-like n=1 Tax=Oopsacas minuta TaxID=111878 RepID=A0AAV7JKF5_9METZ|nr:Solute carrier family 12 member 6-like [Oopsacas minuta]